MFQALAIQLKSPEQQKPAKFIKTEHAASIYVMAGNQIGQFPAQDISASSAFYAVMVIIAINYNQLHPVRIVGGTHGIFAVLNVSRHEKLTKARTEGK